MVTFHEVHPTMKFHSKLELALLVCRQNLLVFINGKGPWSYLVGFWDRREGQFQLLIYCFIVDR